MDDIRCVICHVVCDSSGLCNEHKYDEQLQPDDIRAHIAAILRKEGWRVNRPNGCEHVADVVAREIQPEIQSDITNQLAEAWQAGFREGRRR